MNHCSIEIAHSVLQKWHLQSCSRHVYLSPAYCIFANRQHTTTESWREFHEMWYHGAFFLQYFRCFVKIRVI